jgi:hypothetical protein
MRSRNFKFATRSSGNFSLSNTSYAALDTSLDLTLEAQAGDVIQVGINAVWHSDAAVSGNLDAATLVSAAAVTWFSSKTAVQKPNGVGGWYGEASRLAAIGAAPMLTLVAGDITAGLVTVRLFNKVGAAGTRSLFASDPIFEVWAKNLGPPDPH